jgi:hypothetical protein
VVEDLRPYWSRVLESRPDLDPQSNYYALPLPTSTRDIDVADPLLHYLLAIQTSVSEQLRCRVDGLPAPWVCFALHASVNGGSLDVGVSPEHGLLIGELVIPVLTSGAAFTLRRVNGQVLSEQSRVEDQTIEEPRPGTAFQQWKKLKKQAHQELDKLLNDLREQLEIETGTWPRMYQKGRATRTQDTMEKLVRWLVGREEMFAGDRSATNDLLHELELDPPVLSKKFREK